MMGPILHHAILSLVPDAKFHQEGTEYEGVTWLDSNAQPMPSKDAVLAELELLKTQHSNNEYQRQRALEYPSITDQLDALFHAGIFPPEMAAKIQAVKDKYPKGK